MATAEKHPARQMDFDTLLAGLEQAKADKAIYCRSHEDTPELLIWNYTNKCVYDKLWTPISTIARGLILDMKDRRIVTTPFPKFFNVSEAGNGNVLPEMPFEVFEKLDGSLIILFFHDGKWRASTRGALGTSQAIWAEKYLADFDLSALVKGATYLAEAIYPENRIVIRYDQSGLVLLSGYGEDGYELSANVISDLAERIGWRAAKRYRFETHEELFTTAEGLPEQEEGYVLRFENGHRLKLKGSAYSRVHALISRVTPLGIWELMSANDNLAEIRQYLPEELWWDFDEIQQVISDKINARVEAVGEAKERLSGLSDKEVGLGLRELPADVQGLIFVARKSAIPLLDQEKARHILYRDARPTLNQLEGYEPSFALSRAISDDG